MIFSANSLKKFLENEQEYYKRYVLGVIPPAYAQKEAILGKNLHSLIAYKLRGNDTTKMEKTLCPEEFGLWKNIKLNPILNGKILGVELPFMVKIGQEWLNGRFDAVFEEGETIKILDWKSGKTPPKDDLQTIVYLYCANKLYFGRKICMEYFSLKDGKSVIYNYEAENAYGESILRVIEKINALL